MALGVIIGSLLAEKAPAIVPATTADDAGGDSGAFQILKEA